MRHALRILVNGTEVRLDVDPRTTLADVLRTRLGLTGTHLGCEHGVCGACTVLVDGQAARSCLMFAVQADDTDVLTVEGLGTPDDLHPLQRAFGEHHGLQCGFCTPGFLLSAYELLRDGDADLDGVEDTAAALSGVLCRCTGYRGIIDAVRETGRRHPDGLPPPRNLGGPLVATDAGGAASSTAHGPAAGRGASETAVDLAVPRGEPPAPVAVDRVVDVEPDAVRGAVSDILRALRVLGRTLLGRVGAWRRQQPEAGQER